MTQTTASRLRLPETSDLSRYSQEIRKFPMLAPDEEVSLAQRYRGSGDWAAAYPLITSHLRLVFKIAVGYRGYGLRLEDMISEGNVGLIQAVRRFDPDRGVRLATYAMWWIHATIKEYILNHWSLVKIGTAATQKKLFFNLRREKERLRAIEGGDMSPEQVRQIAATLEVAESDVVNMNRRLFGDRSLNVLVGENGEGEWQDFLVDCGDDQETQFAELEETDQRRKSLARAMHALSERERHILTERRLRDRPVTLEELSQLYGISRERVRQIEERAFNRVQEMMGAQLSKLPKLPAARRRSKDRVLEDV